jgi:hypothetical protein
MSPREFAPIWADLLAAWPNAKVTPDSARLYARRLEPFTTGEVRAAADQLTVESEFFPSLAALWQRCLQLRDRTPGWEQAWDEALAILGA